METKCITHTQHQYTLRYKHIQACTILYPLQSFYCVDRRKTTWWGRVPSMHRGRKAVSQRDLVEESVSKGSWENMEGEMETERSRLKPLTCAAFRTHICVCVASRGSWVCNATEPPSFSSPAFSSSLPSFPSLLPPPRSLHSPGLIATSQAKPGTAASWLLGNAASHSLSLRPAKWRVCL